MQEFKFNLDLLIKEEKILDALNEIEILYHKDPEEMVTRGEMLKTMEIFHQSMLNAQDENAKMRKMIMDFNERQ